jgi:hydroxymethylpyrimidine pyrophosphatase-like HAD family hydrolase
MKFHEAKRYTENDKQKVVLVDIDETICFYTSTRRYDLSEPNHDNIAKINKLHEEGWKVIYWTARGSTSKKDYTKHTHTQLETWGCKYHELVTGTSHNPKPHFDLLIDDKAIRIEEL